MLRLRLRGGLGSTLDRPSPLKCSCFQRPMLMRTLFYALAAQWLCCGAAVGQDACEVAGFCPALPSAMNDLRNVICRYLRKKLLQPNMLPSIIRALLSTWCLVGITRLYWPLDCRRACTSTVRGCNSLGAYAYPLCHQLTATPPPPSGRPPRVHPLLVPPRLGARHAGEPHLGR